MKTQNKTLTLALMGLTLIGLSTATLQAQTLVSEVINEIQVSKQAPEVDLDQFMFVKMIRGWRGLEATNIEINSTGFSSVDGWYNDTQYNLGYVTEILLDDAGEPVLTDEGQPIPVRVDLYAWKIIKYLNGKTIYTAAYSDWNPVTGTATGFYWAYEGDSIFSKIIGAGETTSYDADGAGTYASETKGWSLRPADPNDNGDAGFTRARKEK